MGHKKAKILEAHTKANGYDEKSTLLLLLLIVVVSVAAAAVACAIKYAIFIWCVQSKATTIKCLASVLDWEILCIGRG